MMALFTDAYMRHSAWTVTDVAIGNSYIQM